MFTLKVDPQTIARAHAFLMFERFAGYVVSHDDGWITTLGEIATSSVDR